MHSAHLRAVLTLLLVLGAATMSWGGAVRALAANGPSGQEVTGASCSDNLPSGDVGNSSLEVFDDGGPQYHIVGNVQVFYPFAEALHISAELRKEVSGFDQVLDSADLPPPNSSGQRLSWDMRIDK